MSCISAESSEHAPEVSFAARIWATFKAYRVRRWQYLGARTLSGLSDHMLKDMGIARCEIDSRVYGASPDRTCHDDEDATA